MRHSEFQKICAMLENAFSTQAWQPSQAQVYAAAMHNWTYSFAKRVVVSALMDSDIRPGPSRLRAIAVQEAAPYPSADLCYAEIRYKAEKVGLYGAATDPRCPSWRDAGAPAMSHPIVRDIVGRLGGWPAVCAANEAVQAAWPNMIARAHEDLLRQYSDRVLALIAAGQDATEGRAYTPFSPPSRTLPAVIGTPVPARPAQLAPPPATHGERVAALAPARAKLSGLLEEMGADKIGCALPGVQHELAGG